MCLLGMLSLLSSTHAVLDTTWPMPSGMTAMQQFCQGRTSDVLQQASPGCTGQTMGLCSARANLDRATSLWGGCMQMLLAALRRLAGLAALTKFGRLRLRHLEIRALRAGPSRLMNIRPLLHHPSCWQGWLLRGSCTHRGSCLHADCADIWRVSMLPEEAPSCMSGVGMTGVDVLQLLWPGVGLGGFVALLISSRPLSATSKLRTDLVHLICCDGEGPQTCHPRQI